MTDDRQWDLGPLTQQVQTWWDKQHLSCHSKPSDPLGRPLEGVEWAYTQEDLPDIRICPLFCGWQNDRTQEQLIASLRPELKFAAVKSAGILEQPDAKVAEQIASALLPFPYGPEFTVLVDVIEAAGAQSVRQRNHALVGAGMSGVLVLLGLFLRRGNR